MGYPNHRHHSRGGGESLTLHRAKRLQTLMPKQLGDIYEILYFPAIAITKLSICLQYLSIFVLNREKKFWCLQLFIFINMFYFTATLLVTIFQCTPRAKIWNPQVPGHVSIIKLLLLQLVSLTFYRISLCYHSLWHAYGIFRCLLSANSVSQRSSSLESCRFSTYVSTATTS